MNYIEYEDLFQEEIKEKEPLTCVPSFYPFNHEVSDNHIPSFQFFPYGKKQAIVKTIIDDFEHFMLNFTDIREMSTLISLSYNQIDVILSHVFYHYPSIKWQIDCRVEYNSCASSNLFCRIRIDQVYFMTLGCKIL